MVKSQPLIGVFPLSAPYAPRLVEGIATIDLVIPAEAGIHGGNRSRLPPGRRRTNVKEILRDTTPDFI
jgi:hypothetical protein